MKNFETPEEALQLIRDVLDKAFEGNIGTSEMSARDAFKMKIGMQGLDLTDQDEIKYFGSDNIVALFGSARWADYPNSLDVVLKLNNSIDFMTLDIKIDA